MYRFCRGLLEVKNITKKVYTTLIFSNKINGRQWLSMTIFLCFLEKQDLNSQNNQRKACSSLYLHIFLVEKPEIKTEKYKFGIICLKRLVLSSMDPMKIFLLEIALIFYGILPPCIQNRFSLKQTNFSGVIWILVSLVLA